MNNPLGTNVLNEYTTTQKIKCCKQFKLNVVVVVFSVFITIAVMQAFELGGMLSEAKSIGKDVESIGAKQEVLIEQYASYNNNLSYYLTNF